MKFCQQCGAEVHDDAVVCVKCGCAIQPVAQKTEADNSVSVGLVILSVLIPLFGLIYWVVKSKDRPKCARACGIAALISWGVGILCSVLLSAVVAGGMAGEMMGGAAVYY